MLPAILHNSISTEYFVSAINNIILTVFENRSPLNSLRSLDFLITKSTKPKINIPNIIIVYPCVLQVHAILCAGLIFTYVATTPTSFICCKAKLTPKVLTFLCLHSIFMTIVVTSNGIIAVKTGKHLKYNC